MERNLLLFVGIALLGASLAAASPYDDSDDQAAVIDGMYERRLYEMVVREGQDFLNDYPQHARVDIVRYRLASALFELDRTLEATPHYKKLTRVGSFGFRAEAFLRLGQCELEAEKLGAAYAALQKARELGDEYLLVPITFLMGEVDFRREQFADAEASYREVLARDPDGDYGVDAASSLAWCALRLEHYDEAIQNANELIARRPGKDLVAEMHFLIGESHIEADRPEQAIGSYQKVGSGPFTDAALRGLGFARAETEDHAGAARAFEQLLDEHPGSGFTTEATLRLGVHRLLAGDAQGAWSILKSQELPNDAETLYWRARTHAELGRSDQALAVLERALAAEPDDELRLHINTARGDLLADAGRISEASEAYETAGSTDALRAAAVASFNSGDYERSLQLADAVIAQGDSDAAVLTTHGEALFALDRHNEAAVSFEAVLKTDDTDSHSRALSRLAWCHYLTENHLEAAATFARVVDEHPGAPEAVEALFMQGRSLRDAENDDAAVEAWTAYLDRHPSGEHSSEIRLGLSELMLGSESNEQLRALIAQHPDSPLIPRALLDLGDHLSEDGEYEAAIVQYKDLLDRYGDHELAPHARYGLAWCQVELDRPGLATDLLVWFSQPQQGGSVDADLMASSLELLIWCLGEQGKPAQAETTWHAFKALGPDPERLLNTARTVAEAWEAVGQPERAAPLYAGLAENEVIGVEARVESAWLAIDAGDLELADEHLKAAVANAPADAAIAECRFFLGEAWFDQEMEQRALPHYAAAASVPGHDFLDDAIYKQGFTLLKMENLERAEALFARLVTEHPRSPLAGEALFLQGEANFRQGNWQATLGPLRRVMEEHPGHQVTSKARFRLGLSLAQIEQWEEAQTLLADLARDDPDFEGLAESELWRARSLAAQTHDRAAVAAYQRVIDMDRGVLAARAHIGLGELDRRAGRVDSALSTFLKVAVLFGHDEEVAEALLLAGECLEDLGDEEKARDRYREILDDHPDTVVAAEARQRLTGQ